MPTSRADEPFSLDLLTARASKPVVGPLTIGYGRTAVRRIPISSRIFVGNLSYETSRQDLEALFSQVGQIVEVVLPVDRATDQPRGFAFVEFSDPEAVTGAIALDGTELGGRALRVSEARERGPRPAFGGGGTPGWINDPPRKMSRPKGSRRGLRGRKRGF